MSRPPSSWRDGWGTGRTAFAACLVPTFLTFGCVDRAASTSSEAGTPGQHIAVGPPPADIAYDRAVGGNKDVYVTPSDGGIERRLTTDPAEDMAPRWTADGRALIFSSARSGEWQLWQVAAEGGAARRLRTTAWTEWQSDLSSDGRTLAFLSKKDGPESLWLVDLASGNERLLVRHGPRSVLGNPQWGPDGKQIVFSSNWSLGHQIFLVDVASGKQTRLSGLLSGGCEPRFSPDGRRVIHVTRGGHRPTSRLVETDLATGAEKVVVAWSALNYDPVYSPDGSEIAFASTIAGEYQIYRMRLADGKTWRVTSGPGPARNPDYRPKP